ATAIYQRPNWLMADVHATTPASLAFHQLAFPGWRAFVDGRPAPARAATISSPIPASLGFLVVDVPPGSHGVEVRFGSTRLRTLASSISAATLVLALLWLTPLFRLLTRTLAVRALASGH